MQFMQTVLYCPVLKELPVLSAKDLYQAFWFYIESKPQSGNYEEH